MINKYQIKLITYKAKSWMIHKLGGHTSRDVYWKLAENEKKWKKIILDKKSLALHQAITKTENSLIKKIAKSFMSQPTLKVRRKTGGLSYFTVEGKK